MDSWTGCSVDSMMAVFEDMEAAGLAPDEESFSALLGAMAESGEMTAYDDVLAYLQQLRLRPHPRVLRRVALRLARDGQTRRLDAVRSRCCCSLHGL